MATQLFGPSPLDLQQAQQANLQERATQYAQMNPLQRASQGLYMAGSNLGGGVAGLMGIKDPLAERASTIQSILQSSDPTTAEGMMEIARKFSAAQLPQQAQEAISRAQDMAKASAENKFKLSEASLKEAQVGAVPGEILQRAAQVREINAKLAGTVPTDQMRNAQAIAGASGAEKGSLAWETAYNTALQDAVHGKVSYGATAETIAKEKYGKPFSMLTSDEAKAVNTRAQEVEIAQKRAGATAIQVPLDKIMEKVYGQVDATKSAEAWAKAGEAYNAATPMIDKLGQMSTAMQNAYSGVGADTKLAFAKGLSAFGIPVDVNKLTNTEYANSVGSQLVQSIAHVFPGSQSNKELEQLLKSKPNITQELPTIMRLIRQVQDEMRASTKTYEQLAALPEAERVKTNSNIVQGKTYGKLTRYRALEAQATSGKPMAAADIAEAKKLQQELGVQ